MPKISVVCPAYRRPKYTKDLINSFLIQDYKNSEIIIVDDSGDHNDVKDVVLKAQSKDSRVIYIQNEVNLGFCKNLIKAITSSNSPYILIMGDDDILGTKDTLTHYINAFDDNPNVDFAYSNQIQFNKVYEPDYVYKHFSESRKYSAGRESMDNIWLLSCFISGLALRNREDLADLYPSDNILFPQVELVGKILMTKESFGINKFLIGARAHDEQLGFKAVKGKDIKSDEKHSVYELNFIFDRVVSYACKNNIDTSMLDPKVVNRFFENKHMTIFPSEKINTGNLAIIRVFTQAIKNNIGALFNFHFVFYFLTSLLLPARLLSKVKDWRKKSYIAQFEEDINIFRKHLSEINE